ncbi:hypothetical protein [Burkholderia ubonensis]|uniref:hypothetical protein n=1 Tax=Burkholderia ubonensis TaxID=101571 RepID=UPI002ABDE858|nr:hypothetical protein [Burkholderia ubonensis]
MAEGIMSIERVSKLICYAIWFFTTSSVAVEPAPNHSPTTNEVAAYQAMIDRAKATHLNVDSQAACLSSYKKDLIKDRDGWQADLGESIRKISALEADIARYKAEYDGYVGEHNSASAALGDARAALNKAERDRLQAAKLYSACVSMAGTFGGGGMGGLGCAIYKMGEDNKLKGNIAAAEKRVGAAEVNLNAARQRMDQSGAILDLEQKKQEVALASKKEVERRISRVAEMIYGLNEVSQQLMKMADEFKDQIKEAMEVDVGDGRARSARMAEDIERKFDASYATLNKIVAGAKSDLPSNVVNHCAVQ